MRSARALIGIALIVIGALTIADQGSGGGVWWLVAGLAATAGIAGLLSAARPESSTNL